MLGIIAGTGRLPIPVEAFEAAIRADGKGVDGNLRGFRAGLEAVQKPDVATSARCHEATAARLPQRLRQPTIEKFAGARTRHHRRRRAPARRLSGRRLCAALSRPPRADPRRRCARQGGRPAAARNRAPSCGAHVLRGRDPRRAGEDRPGALCAHRRRGRRQAGRAGEGVRIPEARRRRIVLGAAAVAGAAHSRVRRAPREARALPLGHGSQHHVGERAICASARSPRCGAGGRAPIATPKSSARSSAGSA